MNTSKVAAKTEAETVQTGCCGSAGTHDHADTPATAPHDHSGPAAARTGASAKPAATQKSGHGSGCCCS